MVDWGYMPLYREFSSDDTKPWALTKDRSPIIRILLGVGIALAILLWAKS